MNTPDSRTLIPPSAGWLGAAGIVPFIGCSLFTVFGPLALGDLAAQALAFYGAVILSFLGGIQWGLVTRTSQDRPGQGLSLWHLAPSVVPSLIGWIALLLPVATGLLVLSVAFALVLLQDLRLARSNEAPAWYPSLRMPLTLVVSATLLVTALVQDL